MLYAIQQMIVPAERGPLFSNHPRSLLFIGHSSVRFRTAYLHLFINTLPQPCPLFPDKLIANTSYRNNMLRFIRVKLQLNTQATNVDINNIAIFLIIIPYLGE